jgi:uncharacterized protein (DUF1800 family)
VQGAIERLLNYASIPDTLDSRLAQLSFDFSKPQEVVRWFLLRMLYTQHPLEEKMTLFWHGVLTSSFTKIGGKRGYPLLIQQNKLLRAGAMGRFDDLIKGISTDPAMLWWLDGRLSTGNSPNENYARELMELFTMGIGNYTQNDVHQGALALSGWTIRGGKGVFVPRRHYDGTVTFLGHTGAMGVDDVVRLVCAHPATGKHLAWRMWSFFVYENPSDADLQPLAEAYYASNHSIAAMVRAMLSSPQFFSAKAYRARVKSPLEFVVGAIRLLGLETNAQGLAPILQNMGQVPFDPPNVSGWDGDKLSSAWMSTQSWMTRVNFVNELMAVASGLVPRGQPGSGSSTAGVAHAPLQQLITARQLSTPHALVDYFVATGLDNQLASDRRALLYDTITATPPAGGPSFTLAGGAQVPAAAVRNTLYLLMSMPEYHMN